MFLSKNDIKEYSAIRSKHKGKKLRVLGRGTVVRDTKDLMRSDEYSTAKEKIKKIFADAE